MTDLVTTKLAVEIPDLSHTVVMPEPPRWPTAIVRVTDASTINIVGGTYAIIHEPTAAVYMGSTDRAVRQRVTEHRCRLRTGSNTCRRLQALWTSTTEAEWWVAVWGGRWVEGLLTQLIPRDRRLTLTNDDGPQVGLFVRLSPSEAATLQALADEQKTTRSEVIRRLLLRGHCR